jgi:hypothetical protein
MDIYHRLHHSLIMVFIQMNHSEFAYRYSMLSIIKVINHKFIERKSMIINLDISYKKNEQRYSLYKKTA